MKALCLVTEYPFPPRNGITIPTANQIQVLEQSGYEIHIISSDQINRNFRKRQSALKRIYNEFIGQEPYFTIHYNRSFIEQEIRANGQFDIIYYSPISLHDVAYQFYHLQKHLYGKEAKIISSISDCYTLVSRSQVYKENFKVKYLPRLLIHKLRSYYLGKYESKILNQADIVFVQSETDKEWVRKIGTVSEVLIYTNGVNGKLFNIKNNFNKNLIFVANLKEQSYQLKLRWFLNNCWKEILNHHPDAYLFIYTGSKVNNLELGKFDNLVIENKFFEDIVEIYQGKSVAIAPIFKKLGFMNKVAEAMASGLVVVGDASAFNSMTGLNNELISNNAEEFTKTIIRILDNEKEWEYYQKIFRDYALEHFFWEKRNIGFKKYLDNIKGLS